MVESEAHLALVSGGVRKHTSEVVTSNPYSTLGRQANTTLNVSIGLPFLQCHAVPTKPINEYHKHIFIMSSQIDHNTKCLLYVNINVSQYC